MNEPGCILVFSSYDYHLHEISHSVVIDYLLLGIGHCHCASSASNFMWTRSILDIEGIRWGVVAVAFVAADAGCWSGEAMFDPYQTTFDEEVAPDAAD